MRAHLLQMNIVWEDRPANHALARDMIATAAPDPGDLIVLPELFDSGFTLNRDAALDDGTTKAFLHTLADDTGCTVHGARAITNPDDPARLLNTAYVTAPNTPEPIAEYAKIHPFSYGRELETYDGGPITTPTYPWGPLTASPAVCYDLRFPELFRRATLAGADTLVLGANWPAPRQHHWRALAIARAIENQCWVLAVNRTGDDPHLPYTGGSIIVSPKGDITAELNDEAAVLSAEIDKKEASTWRQAFRVLDDIKIKDLD